MPDIPSAFGLMQGTKNALPLFQANNLVLSYSILTLKIMNKIYSIVAQSYTTLRIKVS
jgi:hypothetical protein